MNHVASTREQYAARICAAWNQAVESIIDTGLLLIEAKSRLPHGQFELMFENKEVPFGSRTGQRLMEIARDPRLANPTHVSLLPPHWGTLYEITKLTDAQFNEAMSHHIIRADMERRDLNNYFKKDKRDKKLADLSERIKKARELLGIQQYGVIYADPPWRFEPYSRETGMDAAADNHYPTMTTDDIATLPVEAAAFEDCVLWLWGTVPMMPQAKEVMDAWGFEYKTHLVWVKDHPGTGYWVRNQHELLLIGTRGKIPAPNSGDQPSSVIDAPVLAHSEKPEVFRELIEGFYPTNAEDPWHLELFARNVAPGWAAWGAEAPSENAA